MGIDQAKFDLKWPSGRPFQMVGFGINAVDWIVQVPHYPLHNSKVRLERLTRMGGGQVATASALCARFGLKVRYVGRVGDDEIGDFSKRSLSEEPMDLSCLQTVPDAVSQFSIIIVDRPTGERTILWDRDPKLIYGPGELQRDWIVAGHILHLDGHDQAASIQAARWAREAGMRVCLDIDRVQPGVEELLALIDFAIPTVNFITRFTGREDWREALLETQRAVDGFVACTLGSDGCAAVWEGDIHEVPGFSVQAVDATGAGDVFHGAFVYALFQDWSVRRCLRFANAAGALAVTRLGARGGIPALPDVLALAESD